MASIITVGQDNWITHVIKNNSGISVLGLSPSDVSCKYWDKLQSRFVPKYLNTTYYIHTNMVMKK